MQTAESPTALSAHCIASPSCPGMTLDPALSPVFLDRGGGGGGGAAGACAGALQGGPPSGKSFEKRSKILHFERKKGGFRAPRNPHGARAWGGGGGGSRKGFLRL